MMNAPRAQSQQMALFDALAVEERKLAPWEELRRVCWSYTQRVQLEACPRHYYYDHFGALKRSALGEPAKATLRTLKGLQNRYLRAGDLVHRGIAGHLRNWRQAVPAMVKRSETACGTLFVGTWNIHDRHGTGN